MRYLLLLPIILTACGLDPKYREEKENKRIAEYSARCEKIGHPLDSEAHKDCVTKLYAAHESKARTASPSVSKSSTYCAPAGNGSTVCY